MGETWTKLKVYGINGNAETLEALVDTGATYTKIPESVATKLGLRVEREVPVEIGDGSQIMRKLCTARLEIEDVSGVMSISLGEEKERISVGYTTLELLGFKVNPITEKLKKTIAKE